MGEKIISDPRAANSRVRRQAQKILFIDDRIPNPELGAGYPRSNKILAQLADDGYQITFYPFIINDEPWKDALEFLPAGTEYVKTLSHHHARDFLTRRQDQFDFVWVSRPHNMRLLLEQIPAPDEWKRLVPHLIYDAEAVFALRDKVRAEVLGLPFDAAQLDHEKHLADRAQSIVSVSDQEAKFFASGNVPVNVLVHSVDLNPTPAAFDGRNGFIFIGPIINKETPNADALLYLLKEVWPYIKASLPQATLKIIGKNTMLGEFRPLLADATAYLGQISEQELIEHANQARVHIIPTRFAAGIPLKALTLAALGLPMVTSLLIQQQLGWKTGQLAPADWKDAGSFASQCIRLHEDRAWWESVRKESLVAVRQLGDPARFKAALDEIMKKNRAGP